MALGSIPGRGAKIPRGMQWGEKTNPPHLPKKEATKKWIQKKYFRKLLVRNQFTEVFPTLDFPGGSDGKSTCL